MNKKIQHKGNVALEEYILKGNRISILEGVLYFGVSNTYEAIRRIKKKGFIIKKSPVTMAKILTRVNKNLKCEHYENLPVSSIVMHEWWLSK
jgi:Sec7-like guanine-nucleotide exchange factor|tara:strand:- start:1075 stop:1350 length:276 start_codon:yes stop_codon:yes gene_type:complete